MNEQARVIKSAVMALRRRGLAGDFPADLVALATAYVREELVTGSTLGDLAWQLGIRAVTLSKWLGPTSCLAPPEPTPEQVADISDARLSPPVPPAVQSAPIAAGAEGPSEAARPRVPTTAQAGLATVLVVGPVRAVWQAARRMQTASMTSAGRYPAGTGSRGPPRELPLGWGRPRGEAART